MKRTILVLLIFAVVAGSAFAIDLLSFPPPVDPGSVMIDVGIGFRYLSWDLGGFLGTRMQVPPLWLQVEYALPVGVPISVGGAFGFTRRVDRWGVGVSANYFTPQLRANWHWGFPVQWLDFYTGLGLGVDIRNVSWEGESDTDVRFYYGMQVGAHFYFTDNIGVVAETGFPYYLKAGLALKFGGTSSDRQGRQTGRSGGQQAGSGEYMLVNADSLNIRGGPSADHAVVGTAPRNARVLVLERSGQWWRIRHGNVEGWVNSQFLVPASQG